MPDAFPVSEVPGDFATPRRARLLVALLAVAATASPDAALAGGSVDGTEAAPLGPPRCLVDRTSASGLPPAVASPVAPGVATQAPVGLRNRLVPTAEVLLITGVMIGWNNMVGSAPWARVDAETIGQNLQSEWVLDEDRFWINQVGHPYQGVWPYGGARSAGLGFWESTLYPFATSAIWELVGETTLPSINDQITTTVAGVVLGEAFHRITGMILEGGDGPWRTIAATAFGPLETANRAILGTRPEVPSPPSRVELRVGARTFDATGAAADGPIPELGVRLTYGLPGDPRFRFARPFDHFDVESTFSAERDPLTTVFGRGVLAGRQYEAGGHRGLFGPVLQFDFAAMRHLSVSTSALGLSIEDRWDVGGGVAIEGTAIASAVMIGAAGYLPERTKHERHYRLGPGGQAQLELRVVALDRLTARLGAREYLIAGAGTTPGTERIRFANGALEVRVAGLHRLGAEAVLAERHATPTFGSAAAEGGAIFRAYYGVVLDGSCR